MVNHMALLQNDQVIQEVECIRGGLVDLVGLVWDMYFGELVTSLKISYSLYVYPMFLP